MFWMFVPDESQGRLEGARARQEERGQSHAQHDRSQDKEPRPGGHLPAGAALY